MQACLILRYDQWVHVGKSENQNLMTESTLKNRNNSAKIVMVGRYACVYMYHVYVGTKKKKIKKKDYHHTAEILKLTDDQKPETFLGSLR